MRQESKRWKTVLEMESGMTHEKFTNTLTGVLGWEARLHVELRVDDQDMGYFCLDLTVAKHGDMESNKEQDEGWRLNDKKDL